MPDPPIRLHLTVSRLSQGVLAPFTLDIQALARFALRNSESSSRFSLSHESENERRAFTKMGAFYTDWRDEGIQLAAAPPMMRYKQFSNWLVLFIWSIWFVWVFG
jgi:hypothetical protein